MKIKNKTSFLRMIQRFVQEGEEEDAIYHFRFLSRI